MAGKSKIVFGGEVLLDLTGDTVDKSNLLKGATAHGADGEPIVGECPFDVDSSEATARAAEILAGRTAGVGGKIVTGTMPNNGAVAHKITEKDQEVTVEQGYHDGSGKVGIDEAEKAKIIPGNIRQGVDILGVEGTMTGMEGVNAQHKTVTPTKNAQTVLPDAGYNYLSQVTVSAIPYNESTNAAGGITVTIG